MSSSYCRQMIEKYRYVKGEINALSSDFDDCRDVLRIGMDNFICDIIICGEPIDKGKLSEWHSKTCDCWNSLVQIISECNEKIAYWQGELQRALAREEAEAIARARANRANYS